VGMIWES